MKDISIIIPFKNTVNTLPRLLNSIPKLDNIEIILIENSDYPMSRDQIGINREYKLLNAPENRYAGGARNVGIEASSGKWIIFADSDDFFSPNAFEIFEHYIDSPHDLIYFGCNSVYDDTLQQGDRHKPFNNIVKDLSTGKCSELKGKLYHVVPWAKMIRRSLIIENQIRFDEVIAANDVYFSTLCAYYSQKFTYDTKQTYIVTTRKGSLAYKWNEDILESRFTVALRRNKFLKMHKLGHYQVSIMFYFYKALKIRPSLLFKFIYKSICFRQNIFVGINNWTKTFFNINIQEKKEGNYIELK